MDYNNTIPHEPVVTEKHSGNHLVPIIVLAILAAGVAMWYFGLDELKQLIGSDDSSYYTEQTQGSQTVKSHLEIQSDMDNLRNDFRALEENLNVR